MFEIRTLIRFFDAGFILKLLIIIMLISLLPIAEIYIFIFLSARMSTYILVASLLTSGLIGLGLSYSIIRTKLRVIKGQIDRGNYPEDEFHSLAGVILASILIITPGFLGDLIGLLMLLPGLSRKAGRSVTRPMEPQIKEIYEYLKLYEIR
jgi:UPF0716 protein FxsA